MVRNCVLPVRERRVSLAEPGSELEGSISGVIAASRYQFFHLFLTGRCCGRTTTSSIGIASTSSLFCLNHGKTSGKPCNNGR